MGDHCSRTITNSDVVVDFENVGVGEFDVDIGVNVDVVAGATRCRGSPLF